MDGEQQPSESTHSDLSGRLDLTTSSGAGVGTGEVGISGISSTLGDPRIKAENLFQKLLQGFCGRQWFLVARHMNLFPLKFVDPFFEGRFGEISNWKIYRLAVIIGPIGASFAAISSIGFLIAYLTGDLKPNNALLSTFTALMVLEIVLLLIWAFALRCNYLFRHMELIFYLFTLGAMILITIWNSLTVTHFHRASRTDTNMTASNNVGYELFCEINMDSSFVFILAACTLVMPTRTKFLFLTILFFWLCQLAFRMVRQHYTVESDVLKTINVLALYQWALLSILVCFAQYISEFNDRFNKMLRYNTHKNLRLAKNQQKMKSGTTSTALESLALKLRVANEVVRQSLQETASSTPNGEVNATLKEAAEGLVYSLKTVAKGNLFKAQVAEDSQGQEAKFVKLYDADEVNALDDNALGIMEKRREEKRIIKRGNTTKLRFNSRLDVEGVGAVLDPSVVGLSPQGIPLETEAKALKILIHGFESKLDSETEMRVGRDFNFSVRTAQLENDDPHLVQMLTEVGSILIQPYLEFLGIDQATASLYFNMIEAQYHPLVLYKNSLHAASVAHFSFSLYRVIAIPGSTAWEEVALLLATASHGLCHAGRGNSFYTKTDSVLSKVFGGDSVADLSAAIMTKIVQSSFEADILMNLDILTFRKIRQRVTNIILSLDLKRHFEILSQIRVLRTSQEYESGNLLTEEDRSKILIMIAKTADLSYAYSEWADHYDWTLRIAEDQFKQGDNELLLGVPISPLCNRKDDTPLMTSTQLGFLQYVARPLIKEIVLWDQSKLLVSELTSFLDANEAKWKEMLQTKTIPKIPHTYVAQGFPPSTWALANATKCFRAMKVADYYVAAEKVKLRWL